MHMCVYVEATVPGCRHIDGWSATPRAGPLLCIPTSQTLSVYTSDPSSQTRQTPRTCHPSRRNKRTKAPRADPDTAVPGRPSDLTDRSRADGRHNWMSEVGSSMVAPADLVWFGSWSLTHVCVPGPKSGCV